MDSREVDYQKIFSTVTQIPVGKVSSYGQIAEIAGLSGRARMVGRALRIAPDELKLPWHRVLRASGESAFPSGHPLRLEQQQRLALEGVLMQNGRVNLRRFRWDPLDELLWHPDPE